MMTKLEAGTYSRYLTPARRIVEVFQVAEVGGDEPDPLWPGKFYYHYEDSYGLSIPFNTEEAALADAENT